MDSVAGSPNSASLLGKLFIRLFLGFIVAQSGCVAMNIPSQRLHDPDDQGGLFGHWKHAKYRQPDLVNSVPGMDPIAVERAADIANQTTFPAEAYVGDVDGTCLDSGCAGCSECDMYDPLATAEKKPEAPEIPWPKFHPVPTRPIYAPHGVH